MHKEIGVGKAHSKIILIGEHAVVYGYPAIALPLHHIEVTCQIIPADSPWTVSYTHLDVYKRQVSDQGPVSYKGLEFTEDLLELRGILDLVLGNASQAVNKAF